MRTEREMVAYALEIDPALLPYVPELLADLEELGSDAELITQVLADCNLPAATRIVDLGCGKGAASVELADELGYQVTGLELFAPFIAGCEALAEQNGVSSLCTFLHGDVLKMAANIGTFDVALCAALGDVLGGPDETIAVMRDYVKPGGLMVLSDLYRAEGGSVDFPGFERYLDREETLAQLTAHGDALVREVLPEADSESAADDDEADDEASLIHARAVALADQYPEHRAALMSFAEDQARENAFIDENFVDVIWVLRRS